MLNPERIAPVIPLFGGARGETGGAATDGTPSDRHPAHRASSPAVAEARAPRLHTVRSHNGHGETDNADVDPEQQRATAEEALVRKLRARSLSISEARTVLRGHQLPADALNDVIDDFTRRGYLDDALLAGHLVTSGTQRKGQGRVALSRALAQRGIPRDVIAAALEEVPDDDADRALEFARTKARALSRLDNDTALRRLVGQLSRRGYSGSVAMTAAKTALSEFVGGGATGVRFVDSD